jgi:hypothetical protein
MPNQLPRLIMPLGLLAVVPMWIAGCSKAGSPHPVEPDLARKTLQDVLQSWQDGAKIESWREHDPEVVVQDIDWEAGRQLESFEILGEGTPLDSILYCEVKIVIADPEAGSSDKTVTYQVGTAPVVTVFRQ